MAYGKAQCCRGSGAVALLALLRGAAAGLVWQDCGLLADVPAVEIVEYSHTPDPIQVGQPYVIRRKFRSLLDKPIGNFSEEFWSYNRSAEDSEQWSSYFHNGPFSRCGAKDYQISCPLQPRTTFLFEDHHPASKGHGPHGEHRAVEHYYVDGRFAGCVVVVFEYSNSSSRPAASTGPAIVL
uniref:Transmembrane 9 superfamily member n=1 Tax=Alexandrium catenella TaxID=2925 RepID=A0A7S1WH96_ALECA